MEPQDSVVRTQQISTGSYPELDQSGPYKSTLLLLKKGKVVPVLN
jgi:hypothetical protein